MANKKPRAIRRQPNAEQSELLEQYSHLYGAALRRYFSKHASQPADVEDLVQEVFVRLAGRAVQEDIHQPEAYLLRTAAHVWRDFLRKRKTHAATAHDEYEDNKHAREEISPEHVLHSRQSLTALLAVLDGLPERTRQVLLLCRVEGMRYKDIAARLGVSVSSVEKHMMKAIAHLAEHLGGQT